MKHNFILTEIINKNNRGGDIFTCKNCGLQKIISFNVNNYDYTWDEYYYIDGCYSNKCLNCDEQLLKSIIL